MFSNSVLLAISVIFIVCKCKEAISEDNFLKPSASVWKEFAEQRLQTLRNLRDKLNGSARIKFINETSVSRSRTWLQNTSSLAKPEPDSRPKVKEVGTGNLLENLETFLSFAPPLKRLISSNLDFKYLVSVVLPKRETFKKLLDIEGKLDPSLKRYLTDKYNTFLTNLVPFSKNLGVSSFVLDSMKIPLDFDSRLGVIKSLLNSEDGLEKFIHSVVDGNILKRVDNGIQSRSGDETELISDQEPDATGQAYRKQQQQLYLSSFKKRLMLPGAIGGGTMKLMSFLRPGNTAFDDVMDQNGQFGHFTYEVRNPEVDNLGYYTGGEMDDMTMSASGGRGHGHGHGHGHSGGHASYGGFLDPFTILGGLAFLTYLGLMLQSSLNRNNTGAVGGKRLSWESRLPVVPINLGPVNIPTKYDYGNRVNRRSERSVIPEPLTVDKVVTDLEEVWEEINLLKKNMHLKANCKGCERTRLCELMKKLVDMNLTFLIDTKAFLSENVNDKQRRRGIWNACSMEWQRKWKIKLT